MRMLSLRIHQVIYIKSCKNTAILLVTCIPKLDNHWFKSIEFSCLRAVVHNR